MSMKRAAYVCVAIDHRRLYADYRVTTSFIVSVSTPGCPEIITYVRSMVKQYTRMLRDLLQLVAQTEVLKIPDNEVFLLRNAHCQL